MKITVINGATAVGKSTALDKLQWELPGRVAVVDGDDMARVALPEQEMTIQMTQDLLNVFQDNLLACAENLSSLQLDHLVMAFVFPEQERFDRLNRIFGAKGLNLNWIALHLDDAHYRKRIGEPEDGQDRTIFDRSVLRNRQITELASANEFPCVDASGLSVDKMCEALAKLIDTSNQKVDPIN